MSPLPPLTLGGVSSSSQCGWTPTFRFIKSARRFNPEGPLPSPARVDGRQAGRGGAKPAGRVLQTGVNAGGVI